MNRLVFPLSLITIWGLVAILGPALPIVPNQIDLTKILSPPTSLEWFGHDDLGRPIADRLIVGARTSFFVSIFVVMLASTVGSCVGMLAAYYGGWADHVLSRVIDIFLAFPGILLAIALAGVMGPGIHNVVLALACVGWVGYARLARGQVLSLKESDQITAARALGATSFRIMFRYLLPALSAPLLIELSFGIASIVIAEAGLSFLGLGVQPPEASWGNMIRDGTRYMLMAPHVVILPGLALMLVVLAVNLLGDWMRDYLDVKANVGRRNQAT
ncbi:MAG: ABC transporter permease [Nitrospirales bacterium]|nr:ABC transporter permease [Nitrospira sp.]MDR4500047.1 ABC transporter permease [Nitrospirales bacterium]